MSLPANQSRLRDSLDSLLRVRAARGKDGRPRDHRRTLGRYGEKLSVEHLLARGFSLLARNYRTRRGEINLIAFDGRTLIFVEVKTHQLGRSQPPASVSPLAYLSAGQLARYRPVAQAYLDDERRKVPTAQKMRFDAIGVLVNADGAVVALEHVEGSA
jgi:putative endonuclease